MTEKCKSCGASYDKKYSVCPACGAFRFTMPLHLKVLAAIAGVYLALTAVMLPLGVFHLIDTGGGAEAANSPAPAEEQAETQADAPAESPAPAETQEEPAPTEQTSPSPPPAASLTVYSKYMRYGGDNGVTHYIDDGKLDLDLLIDPEPKDGAAKPIWSSSDESVFTVDENGVVTPVGTGDATLTVSFGGASETIRIIVLPGSFNKPPAADGESGSPEERDGGESTPPQEEEASDEL